MLHTNSGINVATFSIDVAEIVLHKCMSTQKERSSHSQSISRVEEGACYAEMPKVYYSYEFIEDHHEKPTRSATDGKSTEDYALSERGEDHDILQDNASPEEEEEEEEKEEDEEEEEEEEKEEDEEEEEEEEEEKAEDDIWLIEEKASAASDDVEETLPPKWGPSSGTYGESPLDFIARSLQA